MAYSKLPFFTYIYDTYADSEKEILEFIKKVLTEFSKVRQACIQSDTLE